MVRKTLERLRNRRTGEQGHNAETAASIAAADYLQACARNGVTPNGGPHTSDDLARRDEAPHTRNSTQR